MVIGSSRYTATGTYNSLLIFISLYLQFQLTLRNDRSPIYRLLAEITGLIHVVIFLILIFTVNPFFVKIIAGTAIILVTVCWKFSRYSRFNKSNLVNCFNAMYASLMLVWILFGYFWIIPVLALAFVLNTISRQVAVVCFNEEKIDYPSIPKRTILWEDLSNVILKDGLLTLDFKNDQLIQVIIDNPNTNESLFNSFALEQLSTK